MPSSKKVFILQHVENESAGTILDFLNASGIPYEVVSLYQDEPLPHLESARALVVMGGPMNVDEEERHLFLKKEKLFIRQALKRDLPILGVCLGSQLVARVLGARVYKAKQPEIGWADAVLTAEAGKDPLFSKMPSKILRVLQWHEDTFDLPKGSSLLASGGWVPHQAFRWGRRVWGFQFHIEIQEKILEDWFRNHYDRASVLAEYRFYKETLKEITEKIYRSFFIGG